MSKKTYSDAEKIAYWKDRATKAAPARRAPAARKATAKPAKRAASKKSPPLDRDRWSAPDSLGSRIGSWAGHGAQYLIKALTGFGDYQIGKNSLMTGGMSPPQIINSVSSGGVILRHREYIADITATTSFTDRIYDINPGLPGSFPWLSQIAQGFELYRLRGLVYEFKSMSSDAVLSSSASSALGTVIMATQYNSLNPGFTNQLQMENHEFANASKPSCDFYHPVECKKSLLPASELYIRGGAVPVGGDVRLFDIGQFNIATLGMQNATGVIGQLWCTYEVEFYQHAYTAPQAILTDHIFNSGCLAATPLGSSHSFAGGNSIGLGITTSAITFPNSIRTGRFLVMLRWILTGSAATTSPPLLVAPSPGTFALKSFWATAAGPDNASNGNSAAATSTTLYAAYIVDILGPSVSMTWDTASGTIPASDMDLWVTQVDADIDT